MSDQRYTPRAIERAMQAGMKKENPLIRYNDVIELLDLALTKDKGIAYDCGDTKKAYRLHTRLNKARVLHRTTQPFHLSIYDALEIGIPRNEDGEYGTVVKIIKREQLDSSKIVEL